jgi:hypothetical protein
MISDKKYSRWNMFNFTDDNIATQPRHMGVDVIKNICAHKELESHYVSMWKFGSSISKP